MSLTVQTNIASLIAQTNLNMNSLFMTQTIERLTSGYRINSSADDAAGLVIANQYRSNIAELTQGIRNANDGVSTLQIVDGGLNNISTMLDRMKTLATESSSGTFSGNRATLDQEYQQLVGEITRQASNIGLNAGGSNNSVINVYIGGGSVQANSQIKVDLSGSGNTVDATGLGVNNTTLLAPGSTFGSVNLNAITNLLTGNAAGTSQVLTFQLAGGQSFTATVSSSSTQGITVQNALSQLNSALSPHGLAASIDPTTGHLLISGSVAFTATAAAAGSGTGLVAGTDTSTNGTLYQVSQASPSNKPNATFAALSGTDQEQLVFTSGTNNVTVTLNASNASSVTTALSTLNNALAGLGISAVLDSNGTGVAFQSANSFTVAKAVNTVANGGQTGVFAATTGAGSNFTDTSVSPTITAGVTSNALSAITAINSAIAHLGNVQGSVGAGENKLNYAIGLATSQITSFSAAQSRIRDADMATEAANLTKAQILQQSSVAAMAQANAAPQAVLALLK